MTANSGEAVERTAVQARTPWPSVLAVPSGPPPRRPRRRVRLLALLAVRDEAAELPDLLANLAPHVDGVVAYDDGSADGSADLLRAHPGVLEVLGGARGDWREMDVHRRLVVAAGLAHGADWLLS